MSYLVGTATINQASELYKNFIEAYFPDNEVKPLKNIISMMESGLYKILYIQEDNELVGVAFFTTYPGGEVYLLDYLAIDEQKRALGYGGILLRECVKATNGRPVLIETEYIDAAESEEQRVERERRNRFYEKNGAVKTGLVTNAFGAVYDNWLIGSEQYFSVERVADELSNIYRFMINNPQIYNDNIHIPYL